MAVERLRGQIVEVGGMRAIPWDKGIIGMDEEEPNEDGENCEIRPIRDLSEFPFGKSL